MLKKIILLILIAMLLLLIYITTLWFMSFNSIMDKDGMVYIQTNTTYEENSIDTKQ